MHTRTRARAHTHTHTHTHTSIKHFREFILQSKQFRKSTEPCAYGQTAILLKLEVLKALKIHLLMLYDSKMFTVDNLKHTEKKITPKSL